MTTMPFASMQQLKDLGLKLELPTSLKTKVQEVLLQPSQPGSYDRQYFARAMETTEACLAFVDSEISRLTHERFSGGDAGGARQRLLADPKRAADGALAQLKQRLANEKAEWSRRITKQIMDVQSQADAELSRMLVTATHRGGDLIVDASEEWRTSYSRWSREVFATWGKHLSELLRSKTAHLIQPDLAAIGDIVQDRVAVDLPVATPPALPETAMSAASAEAVETPTLAATIFESFQGGLNALGMLAGMVIIPVVGQLLHESSTQVRAGVFGIAVTPILVFAVWRGRATRKRLIEASKSKATEKLKKAFAQDFKQQIERWKMELERACQAYLQSAQGTVQQAVEPVIARHFDKREQTVAQELARVQLQNDKLMEQINMLKSVRGALSSQLVVDLRRKLSE